MDVNTGNDEKNKKLNYEVFDNPIYNNMLISFTYNFTKHSIMNKLYIIFFMSGLILVNCIDHNKTESNNNSRGSTTGFNKYFGCSINYYGTDCEYYNCYLNITSPCNDNGNCVNNPKYSDYNLNMCVCT